jgi:predicted RNA-binding Zn-ribbon protein involved in translation (DUF1610 family)
MSWFRKPKQKLSATERREVPSDVFDKCAQCGEILYRARLEQNLYVCPECGYHNRIGAEDYIRLLLDDGEYEEHAADLRSADPLGFVDLKPYPQRLEAAERKSAGGEAVRTVIRHPGGDSRLPGGDGLRVHRRQHGLGGRREDRPSGPARAGAPSGRSSSSARRGAPA